MTVSLRHGCRERRCASRFAIMTSSMKVLHGGLSTEGERSFMAEDAPATFERGLRRRVMGNVRGMVPGEVSF
jgi:hypothetical protein